MRASTLPGRRASGHPIGGVDDSGQRIQDRPRSGCPDQGGADAAVRRGLFYRARLDCDPAWARSAACAPLHGSQAAANAYVRLSCEDGLHRETTGWPRRGVRLAAVLAEASPVQTHPLTARSSPSHALSVHPRCSI